MLVENQNCTLCGALSHKLVQMVLTRGGGGGLWTANASSREELKARKALLVALIHADLDYFLACVEDNSACVR